MNITSDKDQNSAAFYRNKTITSCDKEIVALKKLMNDAAGAGQLHIYVKKLTDGATA